MPDGVLSGGGKLDKYLTKTAAHVGSRQEVSVGFLSGATYPDGSSVAMVAAIQEFGAPSVGIPPRPYFRSMIAAHKAEWGDQLGRVLVAQDYNGTAALGSMGQVIAGELRESIVALTAPPLSPVTLMLREMRHLNPDLVVTGATVRDAAARVKAGLSYSGAPTKPLVDTGHLLQSIDYEVTGG
jgi:hypothetical protein